MIVRRFVVTAAAAVALCSVSACGLEAGDETEKEHSAIQAVNFHVGSIEIRNAFLTYPAGSAQTPYLVVTFINTGDAPDTLESVSIPSAVATIGSTQALPQATGQFRPPLAPSPVTLAPGVVVNVVSPDSANEGATIQVQPNGKAPAVGTYLPATFTFASAGTSTTAQVPVVAGGATTNLTQVVPTNQEPLPTESGEKAVN